MIICMVFIKMTIVKMSCIVYMQAQVFCTWQPE